MPALSRGLYFDTLVDVLGISLTALPQSLISDYYISTFSRSRFTGLAQVFAFLRFLKLSTLVVRLSIDGTLLPQSRAALRATFGNTGFPLF